MRTLQEILSEFSSISKNPKKQLERYTKEGKKVIGCMPYYCPEELVHAAGMVPFGICGAETSVSEARRYLPAFICSIIQTTLELGIKGEYSGLSAVMIPILCDSLKSMDGNWRYGVKDIPIIPVAQAQNRKTQAGIEFTASQYRKIMSKLDEISGKDTIDDDIRKSIAIYNRRNASVRRFIDALSSHPEALGASDRNAVFKSSYFIDAVTYTEMINELTDCITSSTFPAAIKGPRLVTCGIIADNSGLLKILDDCNINIVDDVVVHESLRFRFDIPDDSDVFVSLARQVGLIEGCPVLYDPTKYRANFLLDIVTRKNADGVLFVMTKFCDPEEYDIVPLRKKMDSLGIRYLVVEVDQQTTDVEQIRTSIETFCEIVREGAYDE